MFRFVRDGVNYSVNTDDPMVLGNNMTDDYRTVKEMGLSDNDIIKGVNNMFIALKINVLFVLLSVQGSANLARETK